VVRYLAQDDARQANSASRLLESLTVDNPGWISSVVLVEIVWVMEDAYGVDRVGMASILDRLLQTQTLVVQDSEIAWRALALYRGGRADFADCLIERTCAAQGCEKVVTFDKDAARDCGMTLI
jgi:predicted nucleic-acid-binding protein